MPNTWQHSARYLAARLMHKDTGSHVHTLADFLHTIRQEGYTGPLEVVCDNYLQSQEFHDNPEPVYRVVARAGERSFTLAERVDDWGNARQYIACIARRTCVALGKGTLKVVLYDHTSANPAVKPSETALFTLDDLRKKNSDDVM